MIFSRRRFICSPRLPKASVSEGVAAVRGALEVSEGDRTRTQTHARLPLAAGLKQLLRNERQRWIDLTKKAADLNVSEAARLPGVQRETFRDRTTPKLLEVSMGCPRHREGPRTGSPVIAAECPSIRANLECQRRAEYPPPPARRRPNCLTPTGS